jgi:hypothetical protein
MGDHIHYTDLEKREISEVTHRIKKRHVTTLSNMNPIADDMVYLLHHDDELQSVYSKKTIVMASLQKLFHSSDKDKNRTIRERIAACESHIDHQINEERIAKRPSRCSRLCTIL